jgi:glycolate oxidase iron-sulfur subunit
MNKTADEQLLLKAKEQVAQCDRCGTCLTVCPLFGLRDVERVSARGKNAITRALAEGGLKATEEMLAAVNFCLLCQACVDSCPNKVRTDEAMIDVRQYLTNKAGGVGIKYKVLGGVMKRKALVKMGSAALAVVRGLRLNGLVPFGMAPEEYTRDQFANAFAGPAALGPRPQQGVAEVGPLAKVAYFRGCGMQMMFPAAAAATVGILESTTPLIIRDNACCGIPHLAHGLRGDFLALAKENIALYGDVDIVVTDCGSCGGTLKRIGSYFADDPEWRDKAASFSRKIMDLSEYLTKVGYQPRQKLDVTVTYHDSCHLIRGQGIKKQPRELLKATGKFVEMKEADKCCGGAGTFHIDYPDVAAQMIAKKQANIEKTGAAIVVSGCPVCLAQLSKAAAASGKFKALHISQVI